MDVGVKCIRAIQIVVSVEYNIKEELTRNEDLVELSTCERLRYAQGGA